MKILGCRLSENVKLSQNMSDINKKSTYNKRDANLNIVLNVFYGRKQNLFVHLSKKRKYNTSTCVKKISVVSLS